MLRLSISVNPALALGMTQKLTSKGSALWSSITRYPRDEWNDWLSNISANSSVTIPESILMEFDSTGDLFGYPGRLSHSVEAGAGKRRVFAIGNYVNQRLLRPLHNWFMEARGKKKNINIPLLLGILRSFSFGSWSKKPAGSDTKDLERELSTPNSLVTWRYKAATCGSAMQTSSPKIAYRNKTVPGYTLSAQYITNKWCVSVKRGHEDKYPNG